MEALFVVQALQGREAPLARRQGGPHSNALNPGACQTVIQA